MSHLVFFVDDIGLFKLFLCSFLFGTCHQAHINSDPHISRIFLSFFSKTKDRLSYIYLSSVLIRVKKRQSSNKMNAWEQRKSKTCTSEIYGNSATSPGYGPSSALLEQKSQESKKNNETDGDIEDGSNAVVMSFLQSLVPSYSDQKSKVQLVILVMITQFSIF